MNKRKTQIIAMAAGIILAIVGYTMIQKQVDTATTKVSVVVSRSNIESYSMIDSDNLVLKDVPASVVDKNTATEISQVAEKICTTPVYAGKPIDLRTVAQKPDDIGDGQQVGVYIDAARCAGVTEGDIVDIYRLGDDVQGESAPLIASNCRVMRITDEKGVPVKGASAIMQGVSGDVGLMKNPRIVYLKVSPSEVPQVIQGSMDRTKMCIALAKKSKETPPIQVAEPVINKQPETTKKPVATNVVPAQSEVSSTMSPEGSL